MRLDTRIQALNRKLEIAVSYRLDLYYITGTELKCRVWNPWQ